jgi:5'-nucleotidase
MKTFLNSVLYVAAAALVASCASAPEPPGTVTIKILAFNDLHGNLQPPRLSIAAPGPAGTTVAVPAGGAAYMSSAIQSLKAQNPHTAVVSAGDMIGASPLVSALFLDEPTIEVVNAIRIDFNAVGNHEFDKGSQELLRMQTGGCRFPVPTLAIWLRMFLKRMAARCSPQQASRNLPGRAIASR